MSSVVVEATNYLKGNSDGSCNVHEHLSQVILKLFSEGHSDGLDLLEHVSVLVKTGTNSRDAPEMKDAAPASAATTAAAPAAAAPDALKDWVDATLKLYPGGENEDEPPEAGTEIRDVLADANTMAWAGVSLGKETTYNLKLAMQRVAVLNAEETPIAKLGFWGKILGTKADYIVLQGELDSPADAPETPEGGNPDLTPEGAEGANKYTYWVANSVEGDFKRLPNVSPEQIMAARNLKRLMTGNLDTVVGGHPPFPGSTEAGLLRAVIALITTSTHVIPKGLLTADEEDAFLIGDNEDEEFVAATAEALSKSVGAWQLLNTGLNADGRCRNVPAEDDGDDEGEAKSDATPELPPLRALPAGEWGVGCAGERACVRSTVYPGAVGIASGRYYLNVYVGYGTSTSTSNVMYCPAYPSPIEDEQSDMNITEAPDVLEAPLPPPTEEGDEDELSD